MLLELAQPIYMIVKLDRTVDFTDNRPVKIDGRGWDNRQLW